MTNLWFQLSDNLDDEENKDDELYEKDELEVELPELDADEDDILCEQCGEVVEDGVQCSFCGWMVEI